MTARLLTEAELVNLSSAGYALRSLDIAADAMKGLDDLIIEVTHLRAALSPAWVEWKPGDAMPETGWYWTTLATPNNRGYTKALYTAADWHSWNVVAYWPQPLPTPYGKGE